MILFFAVGALMVSGLPVSFDAAIERRPFLQLVTQPWITVTTAALLLYAWHIPSMYEAALRIEVLHAIEDICYTLGGMLFWWPLTRPNHGLRISPGPALLYLATAMASFGILGILNHPGGYGTVPKL